MFYIIQLACKKWNSSINYRFYNIRSIPPCASYYTLPLFRFHIHSPVCQFLCSPTTSVSCPFSLVPIPILSHYLDFTYILSCTKSYAIQLSWFHIHSLLYQFLCSLIVLILHPFSLIPIPMLSHSLDFTSILSCTNSYALP